MNCSAQQMNLSKGNGVHVNGVRISREVIAGEVQQHPSTTPLGAWKAAARALVVRELLVQEASRLGIVAEPIENAGGQRETAEEAVIRTLIAKEVRVPRADIETCRHYYDRNRKRFRSSDIYEAAHILFAADRTCRKLYDDARSRANTVLNALRVQPDRFAAMARAHSACPSAAQGGCLGQIIHGHTTREFEQALVTLEPGCIGGAPFATRYGFHIIRLDRRLAGRELPFDVVSERIAEYLHASVQRRALAQYVARLAGAARVVGIDLMSAEALRVN
ncbi:MAG: peptidylprolyl isomerase [Proteobacteria bacterium]|nr:peptidylprolyl isomerase [Pseudomonadota bacterium]